jgi:hypothetical protein
VKMLRAIGAHNSTYRCVMDLFAELGAAKVVTVNSTFRQRDIQIKLKTSPIGLGFTNCTQPPLQSTQMVGSTQWSFTRQKS